MEKKIIYKKWWVWLIIIIAVGSIAGGRMKKADITHITKYEWNLKDTKKDKIVFDDGTEKEYRYVVLGVENKNNDLKAGEYVLKTNENSQALFMIFITNEYYETVSEIPDEYDFDMVQGLNNLETEIDLKKRTIFIFMPKLQWSRENICKCKII